MMVPTGEKFNKLNNVAFFATALAFPHPWWFYLLSWAVILLPYPIRVVSLPLVVIFYPLLPPLNKISPLVKNESP